MTRASPNTAVVMARATSTRKSGHVGNYPLWMRTLEDKYQRLHKKITENTGIGHHRFNHQVGRSVYDCRLSHAIQKYREISTAKQNVIANSNTRKGDKQDLDCVTNTAETGLSLQRQISKHNDRNQLTQGDMVNSGANRDVTNGGPITQGAELSPGNDGDEVVDTPYHVTSSLGDSDEEIAEALLDKSSERGDSGRRRDAADEDDDDGEDNTKCDDDRGDLTLRTQARSVKTSLSRSSKVTSKSCPAKIQSRNIVHSRPTTRSLLLRSKSAQKNHNMHIQMSEEAKHAITETIHEMNLGDNVKQRDISFIPSHGRRTIKSWTAPRKKRTEHTYNASKVIEGASRKLKFLDDEKEKVIPPVSGHDSCRSSTGSSSHKAGSAILPEIQTDVSKETKYTNNSLRIPGIGKYEINDINDNFEITPPGFDSRYNDVIPVEERESETPPPDIKQRAIEKCSEWLTKYNK